MRQHHTSTRRTALLLVAGLLGLLAAATVAAADTLERGIAAYEAERFEKAYELLKPLAEEGDAEAQYRVAQIYGRPSLGGQDFGEAKVWLERAAKANHPNAILGLGYMYSNGMGVEEDNNRAAEYYRDAAELGSKVARRNLGLFYKNGEGVERDYEEAAEWFRRAAQQGDARAAYELGEIYYYGRGAFELDYDQAHHWFGEAARAGNARAQYALGGLYLQGLGVASDSEVSYVWTLMAAEQGHKAAQQAWDNADWYLDEQQKARVREQVEQGVMPATD
ncbi:MAG: sel1 repeat family protein [Spiribacter salinus]|uniref:Sel1 repeat family protein n=1 Tax=Spiribacter salinus TaxID=1335746 RepID=A0A540VP10_9GAMM|nr:MAG: sel1 repeat family protein [Spiribacter salinus]